MKHLMLDIETLGTSASSPIVSIAAIFFELDGKVGQIFYRIVSLDSALSYGQVEPETLSWWMSQSHDARKIFFSDDAISLKKTLEELSLFIEQNGICREVKVWSKGPSFDNAILAQAYKLLKLPLPWNFRNDRDVRTIIDLAESLASKYPEKLASREGILHNAVSDAIYQIDCVSIAYKILGAN